MLYTKLAFRNVRRSAKDYLIYMVTMTLCTTMFYAFLSICSTHYNPDLGTQFNFNMLSQGMKLAICGVSLLILFLIHYVNRFMLRKKQKEFAVQAIMGMEQKTIGWLFFGETFLLGIISVVLGVLLGAVASQFITAMLLSSFGKSYSFAWTLFPDTVLLTAGFFPLCQILVGIGNVRILYKSKVIDLLTADRENEKPLKKSRFILVICLLYSLMLLWMLYTGTLKYHFYFDVRHPLPVKLMYWGNILFPALTLLWGMISLAFRKKISRGKLVFGFLIGSILTAIPAMSIPGLERTYFLGFDTPTQTQYLTFVVADILFIIAAVIYLSNTALMHWKNADVTHKYHHTNLFLFGQISSKLSTNTKTMTVISVTLTLAICLFVLAPILTGWSLGYLDSRSMYDVQISTAYNHTYETEDLPRTNYEEVTQYLEEHHIAAAYDLTFSEYLPKQEQFHQRVKYDFPPVAIALSDYNAIREMLGYEPIELGQNEFTTQWQLTGEQEDIESFIRTHPILETDAGNLQLSENAVHQDSMGETIYNFYTDVVYVIPDETANQLLAVDRNRYIRTQEPISFEDAMALERMFNEHHAATEEGQPSYAIRTSTAQVNSALTSNFILKAAMIYGAVVLTVMCMTVLALQQLLDAGKFRYRFSVLRKMGVEENEIANLILKQLRVWFGLPVGLAILLSALILGYIMQMVSVEISAYIGYTVLWTQIGAVIGILGILLLCYFISTWLMFRKSVAE